MTISNELRDHVFNWSETHPFSPAHLDCTTAVMLKILDGKCKMKPESKVVMELLYDAVKHQHGHILLDDIHALIDKARLCRSDEMRDIIYEHRLLAETMISRPVMKGFKAMIKEKGLFDSPVVNAIQVEE